MPGRGSYKRKKRAPKNPYADEARGQGYGTRGLRSTRRRTRVRRVRGGTRGMRRGRRK